MNDAFFAEAVDAAALELGRDLTQHELDLLEAARAFAVAALAVGPDVLARLYPDLTVIVQL